MPKKQVKTMLLEAMAMRCSGSLNILSSRLAAAAVAGACLMAPLQAKPDALSQGQQVVDAMDAAFTTPDLAHPADAMCSLSPGMNAIRKSFFKSLQHDFGAVATSALQLEMWRVTPGSGEDRTNVSMVMRIESKDRSNIIRVSDLYLLVTSQTVPAHDDCPEGPAITSAMIFGNPGQPGWYAFPVGSRLPR